MENTAYIGRQPIINRQQHIIGYELLFRVDQNAVKAQITDSIGADSHILINTLSNMSSDWLTANRLAFINISTTMLESDFLELMNPQRVVLEVVESAKTNRKLINRLKELRRRGFGIAVNNFTNYSKNNALFDVANYIKLTIKKANYPTIQALSEKLRKFPIMQVGQKIETKEDFKFALDIGIDYFQGYYFSQPETLSATIIHPGYVNILKLLNMLKNNADLTEIETIFKSDLALSFKLLRYINSAGFGLNTEINSFKHAVTLLGYNKLYRWLTLLLVTAETDDDTPAALMKTAITRGRFMELLGQQQLDHNDQDNLFIIGVFSLLDAILDMPMNKILGSLTLPADITNALLQHEGPYAQYLALAEACEEGGMDQVPALCEQLNLEPQLLNQAHMKALAWVEEMGI